MSKNNLNYSVYVHTNKINGKKYVGQSSNIIERWKNGGKNYFSSTKFHRAIQKYGWENFTHEILYENLNKEAANKIERDLIKKYDSINNGYNIQEGGYTSLTKESLDKMSKSLKQGYTLFNKIMMIWSILYRNVKLSMETMLNNVKLCTQFGCG